MGHFGGTNPDIPRREFGTKLAGGFPTARSTANSMAVFVWNRSSQRSKCLFTFIGSFTLEQWLQKIPVYYCHNEFTDEVPNAHVAERRLKGELPDHVLSQG